MRRSARWFFAAIAGALSSYPVSETSAQSGTATVSRVFEFQGADVVWAVPSPDGRWLVYTQAASEQESHLFVRPVRGGPAVQLTPPGRTHNTVPMFTRTGDRIFYRSTMPRGRNESGSYLMSIPFDPQSGRATGAPRQVTLEPIRAAATSPDGKSIAYVQCCDVMRLRVVPATGGNARTLVDGTDPRAQLVNIAWTSDGASVLYVLPQPGGTSWRLMRVPAAGGTPVEVRRSSAPIGLLAPGGRFSAQVVSHGPNMRQRQLRIRGEDGAIVRHVALPDNFDMRTASWSVDGRAFVGAVRDSRAVIKIAPTGGGPPRTLTSGPEYDWPDGWSADSRTVYYEASVGGRAALGAVSIDGVAGARLESPTGGDRTGWATVVGPYAIGTVGWMDSVRQRVIARHLQTGAEVEITNAKYAPAAQMFIRGAGGTYSTDGDAYLYFERAGDRMELRSVVPGNRPRVLHTFPAANAGRMDVQVQNGRVIYAEDAPDSLRYMFVGGDGASPRRIATIPAGQGAGEIAWTRDGRHVAFAGTGNTLHVLELTPDGSPAGPMRQYQLPFEYSYELAFLPDGKRLTMIAQPRGGPNAVVALVSLDDPARPVILSEADGTSAWGHIMSPDGQWTAYAAELPPKGTTLYRVDLSSVVAAAAKR